MEAAPASKQAVLKIFCQNNSLSDDSSLFDSGDCLFLRLPWLTSWARNRKLSLDKYVAKKGGGCSLNVHLVLSLPMSHHTTTALRSFKETTMKNEKSEISLHYMACVQPCGLSARVKVVCWAGWRSNPTQCQSICSAALQGNMSPRVCHTALYRHNSPCHSYKQKDHKRLS